MDLKDMILVTENDRGTETNMLMTLDDYKSFIAIDDMSELADHLLQLGRTLGEAENFTEYYKAANVTVSARFCLDDIQLGHFLQGLYNDSKEFRFDKEASSSECVAKLKEIGMTDKGWVDDFNLHYEMENRSFERGQTFHNFNDHDYMVLEALSPRNPVMEGTTSKVLNAGIGHIEETAGIGESGNCVLCGHNGSRYGTFFTPLNQISIGDDVTIIDKNGQTHIYEVTDTEVVNPYDNSIKTQGEEKELTLFTCSQKGTMRFVVRCIYKEAVMDE